VGPRSSPEDTGPPAGAVIAEFGTPVTAAGADPTRSASGVGAALGGNADDGPDDGFGMAAVRERSAVRLDVSDVLDAALAARSWPFVPIN
jgi:hypothetical protein